MDSSKTNTVLGICHIADQVRSKASLRRKKHYYQHMTLAKIDGAGIPEVVIRQYFQSSKNQVIALDFLNSLLLTPSNIFVELEDKDTLQSWNVAITSTKGLVDLLEISYKGKVPRVVVVKGANRDIIMGLISTLDQCKTIFIFLLMLSCFIEGREPTKKKAENVINELLNKMS